MRTISPALQAHMAGEVTTLATCWKITRTDGRVLGFTDYVENIIIGSGGTGNLTADSTVVTADNTLYTADGAGGGTGIVYQAATAFTPSTIQCNSNFSVDNLEVDAIIDSIEITEADLSNGLYDYAAISIFLLNYNDVNMGSLILRTGFLGQVTINKEMFTAELRGLAQQLQQNLGYVYSPLCNANLGDARCTLNLDPYTFTGEVTAVVDNKTFSCSELDEGVNYFTNGIITWTSGFNNGLSMEIKAFAGEEFVLMMDLPSNVQVGDFFEAVTGCDKQSTTCINKFDNLLNFRGFPSVPGMNELFETSGTFSGTPSNVAN